MVLHVLDHKAQKAASPRNDQTYFLSQQPCLLLVCRLGLIFPHILTCECFWIQPLKSWMSDRL